MNFKYHNFLSKQLNYYLKNVPYSNIFRKKRYRRKKKNMSFIFIALLLGIFIGWFLGKQQVVSVSANSNTNHMPRFKYFTSLEIENGDTIWDIAKENITEEYDSINDYIKEIKQCNNLSSDRITAGHYLLIPYYAEQPRDIE